MERPPLYTDVYGFPLATAGPLSEGAFMLNAHPSAQQPDDGPLSMLDYGEVVAYIATHDRHDPERTERQAVALMCRTEIALEHGDTFGYPYVVTLTGTVGHPTPGDWVQWVGLKHLVGNVFHATGWMPWTKDTDDEMHAMTWDHDAEPRVEPRIDIATPQQATTTGESA